MALLQKPSDNMQLSRNPSNSMTKLASAFVHKVDPTTDIRYQLVWNFGDYLTEVPRRLGANPALDAASEVLVVAHTDYCSRGHRLPSTELLAKYSHALSLLRDVLDDPFMAHSSETLCAIMILMIVQVFESLLNDKIQFSRQAWKDLVEDGLMTNNVETDWLTYLARLPDLMNRSKLALNGSSTILDVTLLELVAEATSLLDDCKVNIATLQDRLRALDEIPSQFGTWNSLHAHRIRLLGMSLMTGVFVSCVLRSLLGQPASPCSESSQWSNELLHLAQVAAKYRPIAAMPMIFCLFAAWIGTPNECVRESIKTLLVEYTEECMGRASAADLTSNLEWTERRFTLEDTSRDDKELLPW
ncbi:MAG: hypothetical protein M4579_006832 [Chaenotheca gracillima]|nr:MAG: hypothetical protein M4579_006832 [Chaenotheca gracillima]